MASLLVASGSVCCSGDPPTVPSPSLTNAAGADAIVPSPPATIPDAAVFPVADAAGPCAVADASADAPPEPSGPTSVVAEPGDEAAYIYDQQALRTYELVLAQADLDTLDADPAAEQYVNGMLRFEGRDYGPVGIRYKGSAGAFIRCVSGGSIEGPSGPKTCRKLSMKVAFDFVDPEGRFYGLRKLQFHAMRNDSSLMRERLAYALFREMGVPAPRAVHARLLINGTLEGAFVLVEQIDGRFTRSRFSDGGEGNLYKEVWPMHDMAQTYLDALETNEDDAPSAAHMVALANALQAASGSALVDVIDTHLGRDAITTYLAVDRAIGHMDGPIAFYCNMPLGQGNNPGAFGNHNYYWYEATAVPRFWIIPWDLDFAFNGLGFAGQGGAAWYEPASGAACECPAGGQGGAPGGLRRRPATCDKLVQGLALLRDDYEAQVRAFVAGPFRAEAVNAKLDAWSAQIAALVAEQAQDPEQQLPVQTWQSAVASFRQTVDMLRAAASVP